MSVIFQQLEQVIDDHFLTEKVFVVPSHRDGKLAIQGLAKRGKSVLNVKVKTFHDLAMEQVQSKLKKSNLTTLPNVVGRQFIFQALKHLKVKNELTYFKDVQLTPSFCQSFYQTLLDMKQVNVSLESFPEEAFLKGEKGQDIKKVFAIYEEKRKQAKFIDVADLFQLAKKSESPARRERVYVFFPHEAYHVLEKEFFLHYTKDATVIPLELPEVDGGEPLSVMIKREEPVTTNHPFKNLYQVEKAIEEGIPSFSLSAAISEDEEIQSVYRQLKLKEIPFDETVLFYTSQRPYIESLLRLQQKLNLPITFGEGIPMELTKPGKFLKGIFRWIRDDYNVATLAKVLREGAFDYNAVPLPGERMVKLLKDCDIRFGKERYLQKLQEKLDSYKEKEKQGVINLEGRIDQYKQLLKWMSDFLALIPVTKPWEQVNYNDWLENVKVFISTYANGGKQFDEDRQLFNKLAKEELLKAVEQVLDVQSEHLTFSEAISFTEQWLLSLPIGARNPLPGHLHVSPHRNGLYVDRDHVFIVGMDNGKFPGRVKEDPLLLDRERKKIHEEMTLGKAFVKRNSFLFVQVLLATKGQVHLSFPFMDTVENRQSSPAHLFLQLFRIESKDPDSTGERLMEHMQKDVHFIQEDIRSMLQQTEWFGAQIWNNHQLDDALLKEESFENIVQGFKARNARLEESVTEYDGFVSYKEDLDPRENKSMLSPSRLEQLGTCPYSYFLRYVLKIEEEEEEENDRYSWLDAAKRGSVLHDVFERFYRTLKEKNEKPSFEKHLSLILDLCREVLLEKREQLPPPSEMVYELESQEMLESCSLFLKAEEEASEDGEPLFFEYTFGMDGSNPAVIDLPYGKQLQLRGKIDRIDRRPDGTYTVIDYKTGSSYGYGEKNYFNGGRKLQHILYAKAFEKLVEHEGGRVSSSVYIFPTLKGQGERAYRTHSEEQKEAFAQIVDHLCNYLKEGHFPYTDNEDDCKFCNFKRICSRHTYGEELLRKKAKDERATGWQALEEVRKHD
ncbi:PD-(D/E)XK nuclease family protein [Halalkalibacter alkaliphilus]|uniref:PD-(D/E)XK nuclease family protein n=1 Tax=Halalkalibacter alkaliphilus TaxID=2917993 RepID=A0A9X2CVS6_9BACI|nr:PD-(D/E)XK nuclease family protein [Halalkalibacter alkaliphilus]MCL7748754.1 PD-(D/E)XK nuclease family protein [Halalkalibacter alkaliphilus]